MPHPGASAAIALIALLALPMTAAADDLGPPPASCPRGSVGTSEHAGEWCAATTCTTDADCNPRGLHAQGLDYVATDRSVCREVALCVLEEQYQLGGLWPEEPPTRTRRIGRGACVDGQCPAGGECETALRCVPAPEPTPTAPPRAPAEESTPGCAVGPRAAPTFAMLIALAAIVTAGARRTRRPRR